VFRLIEIDPEIDPGTDRSATIFFTTP